MQIDAGYILAAAIGLLAGFGIRWWFWGNKGARVDYEFVHRIVTLELRVDSTQRSTEVLGKAFNSLDKRLSNIESLASPFGVMSQSPGYKAQEKVHDEKTEHRNARPA